MVKKITAKEVTCNRKADEGHKHKEEMVIMLNYKDIKEYL